MWKRTSVPLAVRLCTSTNSYRRVTPEMLERVMSVNGCPRLGGAATFYGSRLGNVSHAARWQSAAVGIRPGRRHCPPTGRALGVRHRHRRAGRVQPEHLPGAHPAGRRAAAR
eukprot:ctg_1038.g373